MASTSRKCDVCHFGNDDVDLCGDWKSSKGLNVHYFCLLSAHSIPQKGKDEEGILGFRIRDIQMSLEKFKTDECHLCGLQSAAVKCDEEGCDRQWHFPCGTRNSCITQFTGDFKSYCSRHVPDCNEGKIHSNAEKCLICYDSMGDYHPANSIIAPCCLQLNAWRKCYNHNKCVMRYVKNAGYASVCINCPMENTDGEVIITKDEWQEVMRSKGIFIPMEDAIWEREGLFKDQVKNKCGFLKCPNRKSGKDVWTCFVCGCFPKHLKCAKVSTFEEYYCPKCYDQSFITRVPK